MDEDHPAAKRKDHSVALDHSKRRELGGLGEWNRPRRMHGEKDMQKIICGVHGHLYY